MNLKVRIGKRSGQIPHPAGQSVQGNCARSFTQTEIAKINYLDENKKEGKDDDKTKGFYKNITTITAFTKDLRIVRSHLLSHYSHTENCVKITF